YVLACRHRHRACDEPGDTGDQDRVVRRLAGGDAHHHAGRGYDRVVRAEHRGAQPVGTGTAMFLVVTTRHTAVYDGELIRLVALAAGACRMATQRDALITY